jgi:hypothetical protein
MEAVAKARRSSKMETLAFQTDFNSTASFVGHLLFGAAAGGLLAMLYWRRPMRQHPFQPILSNRPKLRLAALVFLLPTFIFAGWAYASYLTPFFGAHLSNTAVTFQYRFPDREVKVERFNIERVVKGFTSEKAPWIYLVVFTKDGRRFESAPIKPERFERLKSLLLPSVEASGRQSRRIR